MIYDPIKRKTSKRIFQYQCGLIKIKLPKRMSAVNTIIFTQIMADHGNN